MSIVSVPQHTCRHSGSWASSCFLIFFAKGFGFFSFSFWLAFPFVFQWFSFISLRSQWSSTILVVCPLFFLNFPCFFIGCPVFFPICFPSFSLFFSLVFLNFPYFFSLLLMFFFVRSSRFLYFSIIVPCFSLVFIQFPNLPFGFHWFSDVLLKEAFAQNKQTISPFSFIFSIGFPCFSMGFIINFPNRFRVFHWPWFSLFFINFP